MSYYSKSVIYMIKKKDDDDNENVYIGSTKNFRKRKWEHKNRCNNPNSKGYNLKLYQYIRENGGWDEFNKIVIEKYPCNSKEELVKREDEIMCEIKSNLNNIRAKRSIKEYRIDNLDKIKEQSKKNYENNKDKINERNREYYQNNKEKVAEQIKKYREDNKEKYAEQNKKWYENNKNKVLEQKKEYYELNKEQLAEKAKEYYKNNRDKIKEKRSEKIICDNCGSEVTRCILPSHKKTLKCLNHNK